MWTLTEEQNFLKPRDVNEVEGGNLVDRREAKTRKQFNRRAAGSTLQFPLAIYRFKRKNKQNQNQPCLLKTREVSTYLLHGLHSLPHSRWLLHSLVGFAGQQLLVLWLL